MNSTWLEDFLVLLESGNFSRAAERRFVGQPSFSRRIMALEEWLGAPLIDRATHTVKATPAGERFKVIAEDVLRRLHLAQAELQQISAAQTSKLRFAATHALSLTFFPTWLRRLETPGASTVELVADHMAACESLMIKGEVQFLLCHHHDLAHTRFDTRFLSACVGRDCLLPVAAPQLLAECDAREPPRIEFSGESGLGRILLAVRARTEEQRAPPAFTSHLASVHAAMARAGRGIAWCPLSLVEDDLKKGDLVLASDFGEAVPIEIRLWRSRARQSLVAEALWSKVKLEEPSARATAPSLTTRS